jgi:hypothetical protein
MDFAAHLAADLRILTEALDEPDADITLTLQRFTMAARLAVPSYVGTTLMGTSYGETFSLTAMESRGTASIGSSLKMRMSPADGPLPGSGSAIVLYASQPGAFVDLAADLGWLGGFGPADLILDRDLAISSHASADRQLRDRSIMNQAIGLLISRGLTPEHAELLIDVLAKERGDGRLATARHLLAAPDPSVQR